MPGRPRKQLKRLAEIENAWAALDVLVSKAVPDWIENASRSDDPRYVGWTMLTGAIAQFYDGLGVLTEFYDDRVADAEARKPILAGETVPCQAEQKSA